MVSPLYLDFETAAQLAAFCRAITTEASDRSQDLYVRVYQTYFASMDVLKPDQLETWCAHDWPLDDMTIDMYEACANNGDAFCFSDTFDDDKQQELVVALYKRNETLKKKRKAAGAWPDKS